MSDRCERPILVVGLGCQLGCPASVLLGLMEVSLIEQHLRLSDITALASIDHKALEPGMLEVAEQLALPLMFFSAEQLQAFEPQLSHRSTIAFAHTGCYGVAESAALAMASKLGGSPATLLIPRKTSTRATFALACGQ